MEGFLVFINKVRYILVLLLAIIASGATVYFVTAYQKNHAPSSSVLSAQTQVEDLLVQVGKLMDLPKEIPTIATVSDITKLKDQPFFLNAKNGDKVLIFTQSKEAILYRPSENKIIAVSPLNITATATPIPLNSIKIALYNGAGTKSAELMNTTANEIKNSIPNAVITAQQEASTNDYIKDLVVDLSGKYSDVAKQLGKTFSARVTTNLPSGEAQPDGADILIIVGTK